MSQPTERPARRLAADGVPADAAPRDAALTDAARRRDLERIAYSQGDPAEIGRARAELRALEEAERAPRETSAGAVESVAAQQLQDAGSDGAQGDPPNGVAPRPRTRSRVATVGALLAVLGVGVLLGSFAPQPGADAGTAAAAGSVNGASAAPGASIAASSAFGHRGMAIFDKATGQIIGYESTPPAVAFQIFDRKQTAADFSTFPLAADLQPSSTRLLDTGGGASIFAARDTLARPCLVVVGPNQYAATCATSFDFPKAGVRLSWAPSVGINTAGPAENGRTSPVVYTAVWLADGTVQVSALSQGG